MTEETCALQVGSWITGGSLLNVPKAITEVMYQLKDEGGLVKHDVRRHACSAPNCREMRPDGKQRKQKSDRMTNGEGRVFYSKVNSGLL